MSPNNSKISKIVYCTCARGKKQQQWCSPDVNSSTGKKIRKESTPPAVYGMNKGPTVSEHCESSQQKRFELLPSDFLDLDSSML